MKRVFLILLAMILAISVVAVGCPEPIDDVEEPCVWCPTRPITITSSYGEGSTFDRYGRAVGVILSDDLGVDVVVNVISGAGGRLNNMEIWTAEPDGYTLGILDPASMVTYNIVGVTDFWYEDYEWLGAPAELHYVMVGHPDLPDDIDELVAMSKEIDGGWRIGAVTIGKNELIPPLVLGMDHTFVSGYDGSPETVSGVAKGEIDIAFVEEGVSEPFLKAGDVKPLLTYGTAPNPVLQGWGFEDVPYSDQVGATALNFMYNTIAFAAPPGTPDLIVNTLEDALQAAINYSGMIRWAEDAGLRLGHKYRAAVLVDLERFWAMLAPWEDELREVIAV